MAQRPLGIDVAGYQGQPDWPVVASEGICFAWAKATEGTFYTDEPDFPYDVINGVDAGIYMGAYHYAHPEEDLGAAGAGAEAAYFWNEAGPYIQNGGVYLMPMLDWETDPGSSYDISTASQWVNEWCQDVADYAAGNGAMVKPVVYSYVGFAEDWLDDTTTQWPLWMSDFKNGEIPQTGAPRYTDGWSGWAFWQYADTATYLGFSEQEPDMDVFNGTTNQLLNYVIGTTTGPPTVHVYPATLTERAGDHVAFNVVLDTGGLWLTYQWYFISGGATNMLVGQTGSSLVLTNIQTTNAGTYLVVVENPVWNGHQFSGLEYCSERLSAGHQPGGGARGRRRANIEQRHRQYYLSDQYTTNGTYVSTIQIPDTSAGASYGTGSSASVYGSPSLLIPGTSVDAENEAFLTLSYNKRCLCFAGYCQNYPYGGTDCTSTAGDGGDKWRGFGTVNAAGSYTLADTNTGLFTEGNHTIRSVVSLDGWRRRRRRRQIFECARYLLRQRQGRSF